MADYERGWPEVLDRGGALTLTLTLTLADLRYSIGVVRHLSEEKLSARYTLTVMIDWFALAWLAGGGRGGGRGW